MSGEVSERSQSPLRRVAAIVIASEQVLPTLAFLLHLANRYRDRLAFVGIYHTSDEQRSAGPAQRITTLLQRWGSRQGLGFVVEAIEGDMSPTLVRQVVLDWLESRSDFHWILNSTGGTKPMSHAAFEIAMAAQIPSRRVLYLELNGRWFEWVYNSQDLLDMALLDPANDPDVPPGDVLDRLLRVEDIARVQFPSEVQVLVKPRVDGIDLHAVYGRAEANHWKWDRAFGEMGHRMHGAGVAFEHFVAEGLRRLGLQVEHSVEVRSLSNQPLAESDLVVCRNGRIYCIDIKLPREDDADAHGVQLAKCASDARQLGGSGALAIAIRPGWPKPDNSTQTQAASLRVVLLAQPEMRSLFSRLRDIIDGRLKLDDVLMGLEARMMQHEAFSVLSHMGKIMGRLDRGTYPLDMAIEHAMEFLGKPWCMIGMGLRQWRLQVKKDVSAWNTVPAHWPQVAADIRLALQHAGARHCQNVREDLAWVVYDFRTIEGGPSVGHFESAIQRIHRRQLQE